MKKPINEIERLKLIAGLINEINYNDSVYGVKRTTLTEGKKKKEVTVDTANPYEYRHGLQHELELLGEYTDEALEKAKTTVLKNLTKDVNFYSNLLNAEKSPYTFKETETDKPGMQAKADGYLKKELKKDAKANVQDTLGKKEAGKKKPKGVKVMSDKGVEGKEKVVKEGLEEAKKNKYIAVDEDGDYQLDSDAIEAYLKSVIDPEEIESVDSFMNDDEGYGESSSYFFDVDDSVYKMPTEKEVEDWAKQEISYYLFSKPDEFPGKDMSEGSFMGGVDLGASFDKMKGQMNAEDEFNSLMSKYDWYYEMSDDPRAYTRGLALDRELRDLGKQIGADKAVNLFNAKAPSDRKVTSSFFMEGKEDKHAKIKEALKKALKEEDPQLSKLQKDEENAEKTLAAILTKKAALLNKPGTQS